MEKDDKGPGQSPAPFHADEAYFLRIPWCAELLRDPAFSVYSAPMRFAKPSGEDAFFAETLRTERSIAWCLMLIRDPPGGLESREPISELRMLFAMRNGLNGHPFMLHGGVTAAVVDETMGALLTTSRDRLAALGDADANNFSVYTANINVNYKAPIPIPSTLIVVAKLEEENGKKIKIASSVEDGNGTVFATATSLFIKVMKKPKPKSRI